MWYNISGRFDPWVYVSWQLLIYYITSMLRELLNKLFRSRMTQQWASTISWKYCPQQFHSIIYTQYRCGIVLSLEGCERSQVPVAEVATGSHCLPKSHSKFSTEPQYEECGGGVDSSNVAMEDNPAYQSVDVAAAKPWAVVLKLYGDSTSVTTQMSVRPSVLCATYVVCLRIGFVCVSVHWCACVIFPLSLSYFYYSSHHHSAI